MQTPVVCQHRTLSPCPSPSTITGEWALGAGLWIDSSSGYFDHSVCKSCLQNQLHPLISLLALMASLSPSSSSFPTFNQLLLHWFSDLFPPHPFCFQTSAEPHYCLPHLHGKPRQWSLCLHPFQSILQTVTRLIILKYSPNLLTSIYKTLRHLIANPLSCLPSNLTIELQPTYWDLSTTTINQLNQMWNEERFRIGLLPRSSGMMLFMGRGVGIPRSGLKAKRVVQDSTCQWHSSFYSSLRCKQ